MTQGLWQLLADAADVWMAAVAITVMLIVVLVVTKILRW